MAVRYASAGEWADLYEHADDALWDRAYLPYDDEPARPCAVRLEGPVPSADRLLARAWEAGVKPPFTATQGATRRLPYDGFLSQRQRRRRAT